MRRTWDPTLPAVLLALAMLVGTVVATGGLAPGEWRGRLESGGSYLRLELRPVVEHGTMSVSFHVDPARIEGLDPVTFEQRGAPLALRYVREAGTFVLTGEGGRRAGGPLTFEPSSEFVEKWQALGLDPPTDAELMRLAMDDVRIADVLALHDLGYTGIDAGDVLRLAAHGIPIDWLTELRAFGYPPDLDDAIRLHSHGMSASEVRELSSLGLSLRVDDLLRLHAHGIRADYVAGIVEAGLDGTDVDDVVRLHARGIRPDYVAGIVASHLPAPGIDGIVRLHDHGVGADYVRDLVAAGFSELTVDEIVRIHAHGVSTEFASTVATCTGRHDVGSAILLHDHGVSQEWIRDMADAGYGGLPPAEMTRLHAHGVSTELLRALARAGRTDPTVDEMIRASSRGVENVD